jgi:murein DD-endopeptidase MepM/ murein hydrolase activator NlpD
MTLIYPRLVYPHGESWQGPRPTSTGLHFTSGLPNNVALDFMAPALTPVLAVTRGIITRISGHDPDEGVIGSSVFGRNVYLLDPDGLSYFYTHLDHLAVKVSDRVESGSLVGRVGAWPHDPGRSHTHLGISHPLGTAAARASILRVAKAKRVAIRPRNV